MLSTLAGKTHLSRLQAIIIAAVILVSMYLAVSASRAYTVESLLFNPVIVLLIAASMTLILIAKPAFGLVLLILLSIISLTRNSTLTQYANPAVLLVVLLLALWVLDRAIIRRKFDLITARPFLPLLALVVAALISFGVGQLRWFTFAHQAPLSAQLAGLALILLSAVVFFLSAHLIIELAWLKRVTWIFLCICAVYIGIRVLPGNHTALIWQLFTRATATSVFWIWLVAIAFSQALFNKELRGRWRILLAGLTFATFFVAMTKSYDWKSGWLPALVSLLVIIYFRSPKLSIVLAIAAGVLIVAKDLPSLILVNDEYSYITRLAAWDIVLEKIYRVSPIFGLGPANYRFYTPLFSIMGYNVFFSSHNNFIDLLVQIGMVGLAAFFWFFYEVFRLGWTLWKRVPEGFAQAYVVGSLAGLIATLASGLLGDWIIPYVYNIGIHGFQGTLLAWFFLGGLVALDRIMKIEG